jgi:hypothetical protein
VYVGNASRIFSILTEKRIIWQLNTTIVAEIAEGLVLNTRRKPNNLCEIDAQVQNIPVLLG